MSFLAKVAQKLQKMTDSPPKKIALAAVIAILLLWKSQSGGSQRRAGGGSERSSKSRKSGKGNVDEEFFKRVKVLIKYAIPSWTCKEA